MRSRRCTQAVHATCSQTLAAWRGTAESTCDTICAWLASRSLSPCTCACTQVCWHHHQTADAVTRGAYPAHCVASKDSNSLQRYVFFRHCDTATLAKQECTYSCNECIGGMGRNAEQLVISPVAPPAPGLPVEPCEPASKLKQAWQVRMTVTCLRCTTACRVHKSA